ncbi:hypothetical protein K435DRAFT_860642 [Dendrothele bispora CBS 962.96]|uniref:Uncharacterized protein n=1 Tax=Dendrothele bispora (strain CBS 962.96) TaxID=1314807 RepID=A0A4V4HFC3_DENBC|nr:hypothetical protein K435DRAFT_860642 [Dendrothele bispora CBS 962.96]
MRFIGWTRQKDKVALPTETTTPPSLTKNCELYLYSRPSTHTTFSYSLRLYFSFSLLSFSSKNQSRAPAPSSICSESSARNDKLKRMELYVVHDLIKQDRKVALGVLQGAAKACEEELSMHGTVRLSLTVWLHCSNEKEPHYTVRAYDESGSVTGAMHVSAESGELEVKGWFGSAMKRRRKGRKTSATSAGFDSSGHVQIGSLDWAVLQAVEGFFLDDDVLIHGFCYHTRHCGPAKLVLGTTDIGVMQDLCGFGSEVSGDHRFCDVFTENEWLDYEYAHDLNYYYGSGPGNPLSATVGFPWLKAVTDPFRSRTWDYSTLLSLHLSWDSPCIPFHDNNIPSLIPALGLWNSSQVSPLPITHRPPLSAREFCSSHLVSFLGNVAIERMSCIIGGPTSEQAMTQGVFHQANGTIVNVNTTGTVTREEVFVWVSANEAFVGYVNGERKGVTGGFVERCGLEGVVDADMGDKIWGYGWGVGDAGSMTSQPLPMYRSQPPSGVPEHKDSKSSSGTKVWYYILPQQQQQQQQGSLGRGNTGATSRTNRTHDSREPGNPLQRPPLGHADSSSTLIGSAMERKVNGDADSNAYVVLDTTERLEELRMLMQKDLVASEDGHNSEYVAESDQRRRYISGVCWSALITMDAAYLIVDSRYWVQASQQLDQNWTLVKAGKSTDSKLERLRDWIRSQPPDSRGQEPKTNQIARATHLPSIESLAYLLNLRGSNIPYNPLFHAFLYFGLHKTILFLEFLKSNDQVSEYLASLGIERRDYILLALESE